MPVGDNFTSTSPVNILYRSPILTTLWFILTITPFAAMSSLAQVPAPAHTQAESMLSRHFGKETVNYFSSITQRHYRTSIHANTAPGSPLNRLSFLRNEHTFLSAALKHPTSRFVLLNNLAPLTRSPAELYYARYDEIKKYIPEDFFDKSEDDVVKEYDSRITFPHLIFLGLDESRKGDGINFKIYTGAPYFALDVTPKGSDEQQANAKDVLSSMEEKGLSFYQSRVVMSLSADEGKTLLLPFRVSCAANTHAHLNPCSRCIRSSPRSRRLEQPKQLLRHLRTHHAPCKRRNQARLSPDRRSPSG